MTNADRSQRKTQTNGTLPGSMDRTEDVPANPTSNPTIGDLIAGRLSRRELVVGMLATTVIASAVSPRALQAAGQASQITAPVSADSAFTFPELQAGVDKTHHVADGYNADILIRWGDRVLGSAPDFDPANQQANSQAAQFGYNNDFLGFLPLDGANDHGLLVVNHEYSNVELMFPRDDLQDKPASHADMTRERVDIEMMAHGGSVIEVKRTDGKWQVVSDSQYARRITAKTPMRISGPAAGHALMKTSADPDGEIVHGMINNCAGAMTPWGTWLTCEENFNGYFWGKNAAKSATNAAALKRYGIPGEWYAWGQFHDRFDIAKEPNEVNRFGWVVEIDPLDPNSLPVKRTALGRFKHEGAGNTINKDGRFVVYQGDDQRFDYVYRFVTSRAVDMTDPKANADILDEGTLSVARFDEDGSGTWLPLVFGQGPLTQANGFTDQGAVVINARLAADLLGATKMDRPEDVEVNPKTGNVYVMLTLNEKRKASQVDAANPRADNRFGHILELHPDDGDHAADGFRWDVLVKCGDPSIAEVGATFNPATSASGWFANPDNCAFDADGRLWIATDGNSQERTGRADGIWSLDTQGEARGTARLFFQCPIGAEMCGPVFTPDLETLFVAVQHPGESDESGPSTYATPSTRWPDFNPQMPPRPSVVAITRKGGGRIGS